MEVKTLVHGDDFLSAGVESSMSWLEQELSGAYGVQIQKLAQARIINKKEKSLTASSDARMSAGR